MEPTNKQSSGISPEVSRRITALRWPAMALVVVIHTFQIYAFIPWEQPRFVNIKIAYGAVYSWLYSFLAFGIACGILPFFFFISGYLQFMNPKPYVKTLEKRVRTLIIPMFLWTVIACICVWPLSWWTGDNACFEFLKKPDLSAWIMAFFGDYHEPWKLGICPPVMFQFWFIRDLFLLNVLLPLIYYALQKIPKTFLFISLLLLIFRIRPVVVGNDALFYYALGGYCGMKRIDFFQWVDRHWPWWIAIVGATVGAVYMHTLDNNSLEYNCFVHIASALLLLHISRLIAGNDTAFRLSDKLSGQSFFLYCVHGHLMMEITTALTLIIFPVSSKAGFIVSLFANVILNIAICTGLGLCLKRYLPSVFSFLTSGRIQKTV